MNIALLTSMAFNVIVLVSLFAGKKWIEANVEKTIQHAFDQKLAVTNSDLRTKEAEISALREMVLGGRVQRQNLLDKRRIEAVERIWAATGRLAPFVFVSESMARIDFDAAAKRTPREPNLRAVFDVIANKSLMDNFERERPAINEQLFLTPLAWAYFSAYQSILVGAYMQARMLAEGVEDLGKLIRKEAGKDLLLAALPHHKDFIESNDRWAYHFLLDELKEQLLAELRNMLDGKDVDQAGIDQAKRITDALSKIEEQHAEQRIAAAKSDAHV
jgi:hypothetical protein